MESSVIPAAPFRSRPEPTRGRRQPDKRHAANHARAMPAYSSRTRGTRESRTVEIVIPPAPRNPIMPLLRPSTFNPPRRSAASERPGRQCPPWNLRSFRKFIKPAFGRRHVSVNQRAARMPRRPPLFAETRLIKRNLWENRGGKPDFQPLTGHLHVVHSKYDSSGTYP